jgi:putative transcriptional regulator
MQLYGNTPERALIFTKVETGRSPLIAVKVGRFSTDMKPSVIVLHGLDEKVDAVAIKIAEAEKIPLLTTTKPLEEIKKELLQFEI